MQPTRYLSGLISFVVGLAEAVLVLRIFLRLFAASPTAPFVHWTYSTSGTLLEPFRGIFPTAVISKAYVLDFTALFALVVYGIFGAFLIYLVTWLENAIAAPSHRPAKR